VVALCQKKGSSLRHIGIATRRSSRPPTQGPKASRFWTHKDGRLELGKYGDAKEVARATSSTAIVPHTTPVVENSVYESTAHNLLITGGKPNAFNVRYSRLRSALRYIVIFPVSAPLRRPHKTCEVRSGLFRRMVGWRIGAQRPKRNGGVVAAIGWSFAHDVRT
jgi:hypothetical protein